MEDQVPTPSPPANDTVVKAGSAAAITDCGDKELQFCGQTTPST
jgi:hypothetical protein